MPALPAQPSVLPTRAERDAFAEKYETLAIMYGDPVEVLFEIMADEDEDTRERRGAAESLMAYRYPKLKVVEGEKDKTPMVQFNVTLHDAQVAVVAPNMPMRITAASDSTGLLDDPKSGSND